MAGHQVLQMIMMETGVKTPQKIMTVITMESLIQAMYVRKGTLVGHQDLQQTMILTDVKMLLLKTSMMMRTVFSILSTTVSSVQLVGFLLQLTTEILMAVVILMKTQMMIMMVSMIR